MPLTHAWEISTDKRATGLGQTGCQGTIFVPWESASVYKSSPPGRVTGKCPSCRLLGHMDYTQALSNSDDELFEARPGVHFDNPVLLIQRNWTV